MVNENLINLTINKKPVELVQELKDYEIKKSPLSPAARAKVIKKYGGNYVSENREGYGPVYPSEFDQKLAREAVEGGIEYRKKKEQKICTKICCKEPGKRE